MISEHHAVDLLARVEAMDLRHFPENDEPVDTLAKLARAFAELDDDEREELRCLVTELTSEKLLFLSSLAAEMAIEKDDPGWLDPAIVAHMIEDCRVDYRENIRFLYLVEYAAWRTGANVTRQLGSLQAFSTETTFKRLRAFFADQLGERALKFSGLKEKQVNGRTRFVAA